VSPIIRMGTSVEDGWRSLAERQDAHQPGAARGGRSHEP
jgi:hypothetical protein